MTDKSKPWFRLKLKDDVARKMSREEYEASEHHARFCAKIVRENMPDPTDMLVDLMVYGASPVIYYNGVTNEQESLTEGN